MVTLAGALTSAASISLSAAAPSVEFVFVTMGVFCGLGIGLSTTPGIILAARYFDRNRAIANALCLSGAAAGSSTMPFLIQGGKSIGCFRPEKRPHAGPRTSPT